MKKMMIAIGLFALSTGAIAQNSPNENSVTIEMSDNDLFTSIKPIDASPVVFPTQEELDAKIDGKIDAIKQQLVANQNDAEKVAYLKRELWRFENAIVKPKK